MKTTKPASLTVWTIWHLVAAFAIVLVPSQLRTGKSIWMLPKDELVFLAGLVLTYLLTILYLTLRLRQNRGVSFVELGVAVVAAFGAYSLYILLTESFSSRSLLAAALLLAALFLFLSLTLSANAQKITALLVIGGSLALQPFGAEPGEALTDMVGLGPKPASSTSVINTSLYQIEAQTFRHYFDECVAERRGCRRPGTGGGLSMLAGGYLLATGEGALHFFTVDRSASRLQNKRLPYRIPINSAAYEANVGPNVLNTFRVTDILVRNQGSTFMLLAAHHFWKTEQKCGVLRVSEAQADTARFIVGEENVEWKTVYETSPCLPATGGHLTRGSESGGRMAFTSDGKVLLTVGDHEYNGLHRQPIAAQDRAVSYGKTILIDLATGTARLFSLGHRNPQGLYIDPAGTVWSTEHGPRGGDELNVIKPDVNYGWPLVTYGTDGGKNIWPLNAHQGQHKGFEIPLFAWVPSIAISNLIGVEGKLFPLWQRDLLIASFTKTLFRLRVHEGRAIFVEPITIPGRIRDLLEDANGQIVLYLDGGTLVFLNPVSRAYGTSLSGKGKNIAEEMRGQFLFASCDACHKMKDGTSHGLGPDLAQVVGRKIAGSPGFNYSDALMKHQGAWTREKLDSFLENPQRFAPGSSMAFDGIPHPDDRAALIQFLSASK